MTTEQKDIKFRLGNYDFVQSTAAENLMLEAAGYIEALEAQLVESRNRNLEIIDATITEVFQSHYICSDNFDDIRADVDVNKILKSTKG